MAHFSSELIIMSLRKDVLSLYRQILGLSRKWEAKNPQDTLKERQYIYNEARTQFRKNKNINNESDIQKLIQEAVDRMEVAKHYKIPYPRPVYFPSGSLVKPKRKK